MTDSPHVAASARAAGQVCAQPPAPEAGGAASRGLPRVPLLALAAVWLAGCGARYSSQAAALVEVPDAYAGVPVEAVPLGEWCTDFGMPELRGLSEVMFAQNMSMRGAWARLRQAEASVRGVRAGFFPSIDAGFDATRFKSFGFFARRSAQGLGSLDNVQQPASTDPTHQQDPSGQSITGTRSFTPLELSFFSGSLAASYEIDLWGKLASRYHAAALDAAAVRADAETLALSLTSELAERYLDVVYQRERVALVEEQIDSSRRFLELTLTRLSEGQATALDVTQQKQQLESLGGELATARASLALAVDALAVLLGRPPEAAPEVVRAELPLLPPLPEPGIPAALLDRRPDLRAALLRLQAADSRTAAAVKEWLPTVQLSAGMLLQATGIASLFEGLFWSIAAALQQPVFDGLRRNADIQLAEAQAEQLLFEYGDALLTALREVQDALALDTGYLELLESLRREREAAALALTLARERYVGGAVDYLRVLIALQTLQQVERTLLDARRQALSTRVQLCRALGGTWTTRLEPLPPPGAK